LMIVSAQFVKTKKKRTMEKELNLSILDISALQIIFLFFCKRIICKALIPAVFPFTGVRFLDKRLVCLLTISLTSRTADLLTKSPKEFSL
jgi:hypothetical protein